MLKLQSTSKNNMKKAKLNLNNVLERICWNNRESKYFTSKWTKHSDPSIIKGSITISSRVVLALRIFYRTFQGTCSIMDSYSNRLSRKVGIKSNSSLDKVLESAILLSRLIDQSRSQIRHKGKKLKEPKKKRRKRKKRQKLRPRRKGKEKMRKNWLQKWRSRGISHLRDCQIRLKMQHRSRKSSFKQERKRWQSIHRYLKIDLSRTNHNHLSMLSGQETILSCSTKSLNRVAD